MRHDSQLEDYADLPQAYGGQGLSQAAYCQVFEQFTAFDPTLSVVMGVHQSIGIKPIYLFGTDAQKERFLPDLAAGMPGLRGANGNGEGGRD